MLSPNQLRQKYLDFFSKLPDKPHAVIPSASLVPENDPSTLFTSSGMQPLVPYLLGQPHPMGKRLVDSQKSFRSQDIEEVGDNRHTTFFEMLGNWSLGDYFKKEQLRWFFTFLTKELAIDPQRLFVTVFSGSPQLQIPRDDESVAIWKELFAEVGINAEVGLPNGHIFFYDEHKNWWSRSGTPDKMPAGEPGGPDSEVFYDFGADLHLHENSPFAKLPCHVNCDCGRFMEIGNSVFMQYQKQDDGSFKELPQKNVDFGGGLERILAVLNNDRDVFQTELFWPIIRKLEELSNKSYSENADTRHAMRVITDHIKAGVMLAADGVTPSNKAQGYFARRLIRRAIRYADKIGISKQLMIELIEIIVDMYKDAYPDVKDKQQYIVQTLRTEEEKFRQTLNSGVSQLRKELEDDWQKKRVIWEPNEDTIPSIAFNYYQTHGLPFDVCYDEIIAFFHEKNIPTPMDFAAEYDSVNNIKQRVSEKFEYLVKNKEEVMGKFDKLRKEHAEESRTASVGMFKGGLADHSEITTKYHTTTHLLHAALRKILGTSVQQKGSNITVERLRFDFSQPVALTEEEKQQVEDLVNKWIKADLPVQMQKMSKTAALQSGAVAFFVEKYPDEVSVYTIGEDENWISKELCGGPHVKHTGEIGPVKILKEQSVSAGVRRIYMELTKKQ